MIRSIIFQPSIFRSDPKTKTQIALSQQQKNNIFLNNTNSKIYAGIRLSLKFHDFVLTVYSHHF
jgi:hypothetical protein